MDIGRTLGHYTILSRLGKGGMGEVYAAQDAKLNRRVALKVLPPDVTSNTERLERFRREAQAVAALNHPNIVTIHAVEEIDGVHFITLELVEGQTLHQLITPGGMAIDTFFQTAIPLVDAVAAAHQRGIVHRDLKPSNVMVTAEGRVKVLDFGLAKLQAATAGDASTALADDQLTEEGKVLGTVAYMSPEQAEGKPLDHRTDVFSLGILLYEMATGARPFTGDTRLSVMSSIVKDTPQSITDLNVQLPRHLWRIVKKALEKKVDRRYQSARDLRNDLEELKGEIDSGETELLAETAVGPVVPSATGRGRLAPVILGLLAIAVVAAWWSGWLGGGPEPVPPFQVRQLTSEGALDFSATISQDGTMIAIERQLDEGFDAQARREIFLQSTSGGQALPLTADQGLGPVGGAAFSPDGTQIAFHRIVNPSGPSYASDRGGIYVMPATGGSARQVTQFGFDPSWSPDGLAIVFTRRERISGALPYQRIFTGQRLGLFDFVTETQTDLEIGTDAIQPAWSPNGHRIAFASRDIWTVRRDGTAPVRVTDDLYFDFSPAWHPDGRWLYFCSTRGGSMAIWRVAIDEESGETLDEPQLVKAGDLAEPGMLEFSGDGRKLIYRAYREEAIVEVADFDPVSLQVGADRTEVWTGTRRLRAFDVSPDGEWLAFESLSPQTDIFVMRADGTERHSVTDDFAGERAPRWSPDSSRLAFYSNAEAGTEIWVVNRDGGGKTRLTDTEGYSAWDPVWSPDGKEIIYYLGPSVTRGGAAIVASDVPFDQQEPRVVTMSTYDLGGSQRLFRAADWSPVSERILGLHGLIYTPEAGDMHVPSTELFGFVYARWVGPDGHRFIYHGGTHRVVDPVTEEQHAVEGVPPGYGLRLSRDARRAFLRSRSQTSNIWMLEFKELQ